ncbi:MAG: ArsR family transcriptional regulator [Bacteroidales bacterium]|nr:ArsR family transcriptional regulator [Bacteroidales bacterium]
MLEALITSKTRIKLLLKFFLNSSNSAYLRSLAPELDESTNAIRQELNRFEAANLLVAVNKGNRKYYQANTKHPLFPEINSLLRKYVGLDQIIENVVNKLGNLDSVYLVGQLAHGADSKIIDLWFVGDDIDREYLLRLVEKAESLLERKVRYLIIKMEELPAFLKTKSQEGLLLLWKKGSF